MLTIATVGGIFLCIGALLSFKGWVYWAVASYLIADVCWIWLTFDKGDWQGLFFTVVGTLLGCGAFVKMHIGMMRKDLKI